MAKDWIAYWMARGETAERAAYLAKGSEALASHAVFRVVKIDQEGCQCDGANLPKLASFLCASRGLVLTGRSLTTGRSHQSLSKR